MISLIEVTNEVANVTVAVQPLQPAFCTSHSSRAAGSLGGAMIFVPRGVVTIVSGLGLRLVSPALGFFFGFSAGGATESQRQAGASTTGAAAVWEHLPGVSAIG